MKKTQQNLFEKMEEQYGMYPKSLPINSKMVKTIDKRSQIRRVIKDDVFIHNHTITFDNKTMCWLVEQYIKEFSEYQIGDILWVREPHMLKKDAYDFRRVTNVRIEKLQDISEEDCIAEGIKKVSKDGEIFKYCIYDKKDYSSTPWQNTPRNPKEMYKSIWDPSAKEGYKWINNPFVFVYEFEKLEIRK